MELSFRTDRLGSVLRLAFRSVLRLGLFLLSLVIPRNDALWVFGANGGEAFADNPKYLYQYTVADRDHIRAVWLSRSDAVVAELNQSGYEAYHTDSLYGMWSNLRAGCAFISHGMPDVNRWCSGGTTTVVLWHGVALKRIGWDGYKRKQPVEKAKAILKEALFDRYDWFVVPTGAMIEPFSSAFHINPDRILPLGYPRNDLLVGNVPNEKETDRYDEYRRLYETETTILYTPTKHPETSQRVVDHLRLAEFDEWLYDRDAYLLVKPHPAEPIELRDSEGEREFARIVEVPEGLDVYPLLQYADTLVTDYSSLYFDYLLLDRSVVFYPFDLEEYRSIRGFYFEYDAVTPGPVASDFDGLLEALDRRFDEEFAAERKSVRERFLQPVVTNRCEAVCDRFDPRTTGSTSSSTTDHRNHQ